MEGLVTQAHFANILAERYPLVEDLAVEIAERLGVAPSYLLRVSLADRETLDRAERIFERLSMQSVTEVEVDELEDRHDALTVELTTSLMKAVFYQRMNDQAAHEYLHSSYLNFYLEKYGRPGEADVPLPLKKALLFYRIQYFRSKNHYHDVLGDSARLADLMETGSEAWLTVQHFKMEAHIHLKQFEPAKQVFDLTMRHVYENRMFHRLSGSYVAYSGYCFSMGMIQEALLALSMAEANLVYLDNQGDLMPTILHNRIMMLTLTGELGKAMEEIKRFEELIAREPEDTQRQFIPITRIYRCEAALVQENWSLLSQEIERLRESYITEDQQMSLAYYDCRLALAAGNKEAFLRYAQACLPYYEATGQTLRLETLYEELATVSEDQRRYKESSGYYRKLAYLLKNNAADRT
ncbi:XRE family transcriptional regulator [Paenibacillus sp. DMB20]|uniref:XRE family transcriptional regulator n=1 Tax=Paenibacillus sp. DMB20 TaxID=1642570 RepID=UPI000AE2C8D2|nr:XRE family transcriptional regulator [Paenibacillus sp. DMB20]